jgi:hypothetical protein
MRISNEPEERKKERERRVEREKNPIYSGHLCVCQQPRAAHAHRSDQFQNPTITPSGRREKKYADNSEHSACKPLEPIVL